MKTFYILLSPQYDCHSGQCWSCQYSQCWTGDHAADPDCCRLAHPRHQSAHRCRLAAVSQVSDRREGKCVGKEESLL